MNINETQININQDAIDAATKHFNVDQKLRTAKPKRKPYVRTIPLSWICQASRLKGKALHLGIMLWYLAGVSKNAEVKVNRKMLDEFGIHRETARRALLQLEQFDLVKVKRDRLKRPQIIIVDDSGMVPRA